MKCRRLFRPSPHSRLRSIVYRREFLATSAALAPQTSAPRPNILWITCEDIGPNLGCYGDRYASTPNLDRLAAQGLRYENAWSNAPVCAPARTTIISGMYPPSTGSEHMRSHTHLPSSMRMFPSLLRDAGYYTSNNVKEDYNLAHTGKVWDESSNKAHWRKRTSGQPFFSVFNFTTTHESQVRTRPHTWQHDPARAIVPPYHPDTPEVRQDWAQYADKITQMDQQASEVLAQLRTDKLDQDTIVFFFGDHGAGMPRHKRWPYNSGCRVPMLVHIPDRFQHLRPPEYRAGAASERLVGFVDLAPTVLQLAGVSLPSYLQGAPFLGSKPADQRVVHGFRGRMDERYDMVRSVRDRRYVYVRNYMPHKVYGQYLDYMFQTPTTRVWKEMFDAGKLNATQQAFWKPKPAEELYDLTADPHEIRNLAGNPDYRSVQERMRREQQQHALRIRDVGFLPEDEIHSRSRADSPYQMGHEDGRYPLRTVLETAEAATLSRLQNAAKLLGHDDSAVRYWAAMSWVIAGKDLKAPEVSLLQRALADTAPSVRIAAAEALMRFAPEPAAREALRNVLLLCDAGAHWTIVATRALNAIDAAARRLQPGPELFAGLPLEDPNTHERYRTYVERLLASIRDRKG